MSESRERINEALDLAASGAIEDACRALWPLVREAEGREEALFTLACCYERASQIPPAAYLFGWVAERYPDFAPAHERLDRCRKLMAERGLYEDFQDSGHVACAACTLRYRAELPLCPYCGGEVAVQRDAAPLEATEEQRPKEFLDQIGADLDRAWRNVQHRFDEFTKREDLSGTALRVQELAREARDRARTFAESDTAKRLTKTVGDFGDEAARRARAVAESEPVKKLARQSRELGEEAIARVRSVASGGEGKEGTGSTEAGDPSQQDSLTAGERPGGGWTSLYRSIEKGIAELQRRMDRITGRKPDQDPQ